MLHIFILMPGSKKQQFSCSNPTEEITLFFRVHLILMSLAHWNSFSLFKNHPIHQQGLLPPTNNQHICSAASPCWLCGGKVPKVDVKHVKCYLPYLLGHWIFMRLDTGVSLQPAVQRTSSSPLQSSNKLDPPTCNCFHPSQRSSFTSHLRLFSNKALISPEADNRFLFQFARGAVQPLPLWGAPGRVGEGTLRRRGGMREAVTPCSCSAVMPIYPPWHHRGHALTSAGISPPLFTLTHAFPLCSEETAPNSLCITRAFREAPVAAQPRLDCRDCCLAVPPSCGVGSDSLSMAAEIAVVVSLNICFLC